MDAVHPRARPSECVPSENGGGWEVQIVRRPAVVQSRIWIFTASFSEWDANRVVWKGRRSTCAGLAGRARNDRRPAIVRVRGGSGRGAVHLLKIREGGRRIFRGGGGGCGLDDRNREGGLKTFEGGCASMLAIGKRGGCACRHFHPQRHLVVPRIQSNSSRRPEHVRRRGPLLNQGSF
jgi:hypothetical protein